MRHRTLLTGLALIVPQSSTTRPARLYSRTPTGIRRRHRRRQGQRAVRRWNSACAPPRERGLGRRRHRPRAPPSHPSPASPVDRLAPHPAEPEPPPSASSSEASAPAAATAEVAVAAEHLRRKHHIGLGEAVNELARAGLAQKKMPTRFRQRTANVGLKVDVTDIASTLELLDQSDAEDTR